MPGSKRRALKKLLSPNSNPTDKSLSSPDADESPSSNSLSQVISPPPLQEQEKGNLPPPVSLSDKEIQEDLILENMHQRENQIGHSTSPLGIQDQSSSTIAQTAQPIQPRGGGMYGNAFGLGGGNGGGKKKKSSRQKFEERQARKTEALLNTAPPDDPNWNAQLEKERQEEIRIIGDACTVLGRDLYEISPDGHCMYSAIADQLAEIGIIPAKDAENYTVTRHAAAKFMLSHPDDFIPFLPSITGEDSAGATDDGIISEEGFKKYCQLVAETGEWGGEPEIQALSRQFNVPIHVFQHGPPVVVSHGGSSDSFGGAMTPEQSLQSGDKVVRISYHKRMYGLGEHYNSLRKV
ncbi:uncharacterized protein L201_000450 [Kwoniella dendrophila CBS 6074]|uniref:OTU domain-containing protein n=1 Tax=Kwoniella dendrophila CBS 6074 TaxID=1295534 RepID=A0AAX4JJJ4_9TREE